MEVTYTITLEDLLRYGEHLYRTSDRPKRAKRAWCVSAQLVFVASAAYLYWEIGYVNWLIILIGGLAVASLLSLPRTLDRLWRSATYRQFILKPEQSDVGSIRLIIEPDSITEIATNRETRRRWAELHKVEETGDYLYLLDSSKGAFIIPRHSFADVQVYEELRRQIFAYAPQRPA